MTSLRRFAQAWAAQQRQQGAAPRLDRYRSDLERRYAQHLELQQRAGSIDSWKYEAVTLRLADGARYTPDFLLMMPVGRIELHECKGFAREAGMVRLRVAAELFPCFRFVLVREESGT